MNDVRSLLTIAGTDPSGGAGVPVDLQVFRDHGFHGLSAITAVVWQNTTEVRGFEPVEADRLARQLDAVFDDIAVAGIKIGMLGTAENARSVARTLDSLDDPPPTVLDPVLTSGTGAASLGGAGLIDALRTHLFAQIDVVTPNVPEAERLLETEIETRPAMRRAASELVELGPRVALVKAGHLPEDGDETGIADVVAIRTGEETLAEATEKLPRVAEDVRGTGCQLSSAIAACLAEGDDPRTAIDRARRYLNRLQRDSAVRIGRGRPVVVRVGSDRSGEEP